MDDEIVTIIFTWLVFLFMGMAITYDNDDKLANSPELRQCLSQSGTTWQWGECVIILNQK